MLNSAKYQKAIISFDVNSIQIVGKNNIGKTSLISVLNFLYIPNQKDWNFDHQALETLKYYFKKLDKNYIVFEIFKNSYFCILMKRSDNNRLEYYKINSSYDDIKNDFFNKRENGDLLLDFITIQSNLIGNIEELDSNKFKALLYGKSKRDKTIIWLNDNSTQKTFSKIYKYLLNTKLISNEKVKESLLIADNKNDEIREFTPSDNQKIEDIKKHQKYIEKLENIKNNFFIFKSIVEEYYIEDDRLYTLYFYFNTLYNKELNKINKNKNILGQEVEKIELEEIKPLDRKKIKLAEEIGSYKTNITNIIFRIREKTDEITKIENYESFELLKLAFENLTRERDDLKYSLSQIKKENYTLENMQNIISNEEDKIFKIENKINNFENLLIHHIADDIEKKKLIYSLLSDDILNLDKSMIVSKINNINKNILEIFDGKIEITSIKQRDFLTIDSLNIQLKNSKKNLEKHKEIYNNIKNYKDKQNKLEQLEKEINIISNQISQIEKLPKLKEQLLNFEDEQKKLEKEKEHSQNHQKEIEEKIKKLNIIIKEKNSKKSEYENRLNTLNTYYLQFKDDLEKLEENSIKYENKKEIDELFDDIKKLKKFLSTLKSKKDITFSNLKNILHKDNAYEKDFIKEVEEELFSIEDRQRSIDALIDSITNDISKPTGDFIKHLEQFQGYITSLNTKFKKYKISDLKTIEIKLHPNKTLINELKLISNIDKQTLFQDDYNQKMEILREYINKSKKFHLSDLFDIKFIINGNSVNLNKQTESNGTDRILKITLFILIMRDLIIQDENNKLAIYIDELGEVDDDNIYELIKRCKENNFIPIFAAPDKKPHIDKYYDLIEDKNTKKIIVDDNRAIYVKNRI